MSSSRRRRHIGEPPPGDEAPGRPAKTIKHCSSSDGHHNKETTMDTTAELVLPTTEMGYILLSPCYVSLPEGTRSKIPLTTWVDVSLGDDAENHVENDTESTAPAYCSHCKLVLQEQRQCDHSKTLDDREVSLVLNVNSAGRFQGTISDMVHPKQQQQQPEEQQNRSCRQKRRSDAALLMGAVLEAQDNAYISIQSLKVLIHEQPKSDLGASLVSLLVTVSFPALATTGPGSSKSIVPLARRPRNGTNCKPLAPSIQFILSVIRSDWGRLDTKMKDLGRTENEEMMTATKNSKTADFFPSKLSLEELYIRIQGSSSSSSSMETPHDGEHEQQGEDSTRQIISLLNLPVDILQTQIAPFLRAKSLDSLRCSCKTLHRTLQAVVPGLKLRLYKHQITSLWWMRRREIQPISEKGGHDALISNQHTNDGADNDPIRAMTGGQSVWLCPRWTNHHTVRGSSQQSGLRIHQLTGNEVDTETEQSFLAREGARGGLLCDDPGLGKTITILSLILTSFGISTEVANDEKLNIKESPTSKSQHVNPEEQIFRAYWKEEITPDFRRPALSRLLTKLKKLDPSAGVFVRPIDPEGDGCEDYFDVIDTPICLNDIYKKISSNAYGDGNSDFSAFVSDVELCFQNAMEYNPPEHSVHSAAKNLLGRFREELLVQFKHEQLGSVRGSASNTAMKPNSSLAVLMQQKTQQDFQKSLIRSSTSLLVIPPVLMEHWEEQLKMHVNFSYCTDKVPLIYEYTPARKSALGMEEALRLCQVDKTHCPLVFLDKAGTHKLPSAEFLSMFSIVATTTKRFANEWKNGSFQEEIQRKQAENGADGDGKYVNYRLMEYGPSDEEACPLLKVNFLRLVVDEGHAMGRGKGNSAIRFASWISAQRRWAMTGTPTKQTASQNGLTNMLGLMAFLKHDFFTARLDGDKVWKRHIAKSWNDGHLASFYRLKSLLSLLMIRHTKLDIEELPLPVFETTIIPMSPLQVMTYNALVTIVQTNLLLTSFKGAKTSGEQDSLLHRSQAKFAQEALTNIRLVCCGGTLVFPTITEKNWIEFFDLCKFKHHMSPANIKKLEQYINRATVTEQPTACSCCGMLLSTLLVLPCSCLLCTECMPSDTNVCLMCDQEFDVDDFQRLQPGLDMQWKNTDPAEEERLKEKKGESNLASSTTVDQADQGTGSNIPAEAGDQLPEQGQDQLLIRPPSERRRTQKPGDGHICEYSRSFTPGKCTLCFAEHNYCKLVNSNSCCEVCNQKAEDCPEYESKSYYLYQKLARLYKEQQNRDRNFLPSFCADQYNQPDNRQRHLKVIVFSQFRKTLNIVGDRLLRGFGTAHVAEYWGTYRSSELHKFIHDPDCFVMLLGKDGSEGLDLSFVTNLVFLEAVWDKSLEQQAVARAWRMGATGPVKVETLLAKDSVEEQLWNLEQVVTDETNSLAPEEGTTYSEDVQNVCSTSETASRADYQRAKIHFCLKNMKLIPEIELVPLPSPKQGLISEEVQHSHVAVKDEPPAKKRKTAGRQVRFMV